MARHVCSLFDAGVWAYDPNTGLCIHLHRVGAQVAAEGDQQEVALQVVPPQLPGSHLCWRQHLWGQQRSSRRLSARWQGGYEVTISRLVRRPRTSASTPDAGGPASAASLHFRMSSRRLPASQHHTWQSSVTLLPR